MVKEDSAEELRRIEKEKKKRLKQFERALARKRETERLRVESFRSETEKLRLEEDARRESFDEATDDLFYRERFLKSVEEKSIQSSHRTTTTLIRW